MLVHLCHHDCVGSASGDVTPVNVVSHLSAGDVTLVGDGRPTHISARDP